MGRKVEVRSGGVWNLVFFFLFLAALFGSIGLMVRAWGWMFG